MDAKNTGSLIYGKNPVYECLLRNYKRINKIYIQEKISFDNRLKKIYDLALEYKIPIQRISFKKFENIFEKDTNLQCVVASVSPIEYMELDDFLNIKKEGYKKVVILDNISDPHNFGAIIRTAAAGGFDGIIIQNRRCAGVSSLVEKISSGAVNHIPIIKTTSLSSTVDTLKKNDFWVIATQMEAKQNYYEIDYTDMNFAIVMGSEGSGISKTILNKADFTVKLESEFESLNVSVTAAVLIYEALRQIKIKSAF